MKQELLSFVIPAWNEEKTLEKLVSQVQAVKFPANIKIEIIIVNDCSTDQTPAIAKALSQQNRNITYIDNAQNLGKSQSVKAGLLKTKGSIVVVQDADLEYDPNELVRLLELMTTNNLDVVYGNRFGKKNEVIYWQNYVGNRFLSVVSNIFTYPRIRKWIPDMEVCYKMVKGDIARDIAKGIVSKSVFGLEPELTAKLSRYKRGSKHLKFGVVPITYQARTIEEGKKMKAVSDGTKALKEIIVFNLRG